MFSVVPVGLKSSNQDLLCLKHDKKIVLYNESVGFELIKHFFLGLIEDWINPNVFTPLDAKTNRLTVLKSCKILLSSTSL